MNNEELEEELERIIKNYPQNDCDGNQCECEKGYVDGEYYACSHCYYAVDMIKHQINDVTEEVIGKDESEEMDLNSTDLYAATIAQKNLIRNELRAEQRERRDRLLEIGK